MHAAALYEAGVSGCGVTLTTDDSLGYVDEIDCPECRALVAREREALDLPPISYGGKL